MTASSSVFGTPEDRREWWPDATLGGAVAFVGLAEQTSGFQFLEGLTRDSLVLIPASAWPQGCPGGSRAPHWWSSG